jgi:alpha-L-fucosidase
MKFHLLALNLLLSASMSMISLHAQSSARTPDEQKALDSRLAWWHDAKFGLFIHWGIYAVPAHGEWYFNQSPLTVEQYSEFAKQFNPVEYDPEKWVAMAKNAGVKYIVITAKHHDGFCLWDTKATDYNVVKATPYGKDILRPLSEACQKQGIRFCTYYSIMDWHHPSQFDGKKTGTQMHPEQKAGYIAYMKQELQELVVDYHTQLIWFDGEWPAWWTKDDGQDLYDFLMKLNPDLIINNRVANERNGMDGMSSGKPVGDYGTPEGRIPAIGFGPGVYWETCMTMNDSWGFNAQDHDWKSPQTLLRNLIDIVSKGGNYLLNVGPTAQGIIPPESVERLGVMGQWLKVNGEAIYGTSASPFRKLAWGRATQKPGKLFLSVFKWPADGNLVVPMRNEVTRAYLLATPDTTVGVTTSADGVHLKLPETTRDPIATVVVLELNGPVQPLSESDKKP